MRHATCYGGQLVCWFMDDVVDRDSREIRRLLLLIHKESRDSLRETTCLQCIRISLIGL